MTAKSPRGAKRSKILSASQSNAKTSLTAQQFTDELQRDRLSRVQGEDLLLQEQRKIQLRIKALKEDLPHLHGQKYYTWQREFFESRNKINLLCAANQIGKALVLQERVATPDGWRVLKDIEVGDLVMDVQGRPTKVIDIPFVGVDDFYRITFNDDTYVDASANHLWICKGYEQRFRKKYKSRTGREWENPTYGQWVEKSTREILEEGKYCPTTSGTKRFSIPVTSAVEYEEKDLFDPYYVGLLIGNGSLASVGASVLFHVEDTDLAEYASKYGNQRNLDRNVKIVGIRHEVYRQLVTLGLNKLSYLKEIPPAYLHGSIEQRKSLLAGLLDTDGCFDSGGNTTFSTTSKLLSEQVEELICSLGGLAQTRVKKSGYKKDGKFIQCNDCFETTVWTEFNPFRSRRKSSKWYLRDRYKQERVITKIEYLGKQVGKCITVDNVDGSFLCTNKYIVTHNSTCLIKKNIEWAGNVNLWPELWSTTPKMFWYFYPSNQVANVEFEKKWVPQYLPRGAMKSDKNYGWDAEYIRGDLEAVHFKSGVSIYVKTYGQKIINLQTSTVHMISCFTAGHLIITSTGLKRVEDVKVGDRLLGEGGWNTVTQAVVQHAPVSKKEFTNGEVLEATDDHPMWTYNRGWVRFSELTPEDVLATFPGWKIIRKLYLLGERTISETPGVPTLGRAITTAVKGVRRIGSYTWICGNILTRGKFQKVTSFTTKISIRWIILSKIWSSLHALNTREFTRKKSGSSNSLLHISAGGVGQNSYLGVLKRLRITFVNLVGERRSQGHVKCVTQNFFLRKILNAVLQNVLQFGAGVLEKFFLELVLGVMKFFSVGRASLKSIVQETAQTEIKAIHTITVDNSHTYLSNGFYCHNCDEEMPPEFVDELLARLRATGGYFNQVFTATAGYELWYRAMECIGHEDEAFKTAYKRVISLYDCGQYEDGTPSSWTPERMAEAEASCTSKKEVLKRIHGRFVRDEGLRYEAFDPDRNVRAPEPVPSNWKWYSAVDVGSGGKGRSAGAVVFLAVSPDFTRGRITRSWRGDYEETTAADILRKFRELRGSTPISQAGYDYASREFGIIAARSGEGFVRADKSRVSGEATLNTLFKAGALTIDAGVYHNQKLIAELMSVPGGAEKNRKYVDDLCDASKYCCALVPWDFTKISPGASQFMEEQRDEIPQAQWTKEEYAAWEIRQRRGEFETSKKDDWSDFERECSEWNDLYGS